MCRWNILSKENNLLGLVVFHIDYLPSTTTMSAPLVNPHPLPIGGENNNHINKDNNPQVQGF